MPTSALDALPPELHFLQDHVHGQRRAFQTASWMRQCAFDDQIWTVSCENTFTIDWSVPLGTSGRLLTHRDHTRTLDFCKAFVIAQSSPVGVARGVFNKRTNYNKIRNALHVLDYFLLRSDTFGIDQHGFETLGEDDLVTALADIASNSHISTAVYGWPDRLSTWLLLRADGIPKGDLESLLDRHPFLSADVPDQIEFQTRLLPSQVANVRAALWHLKLYGSAKNNGDYRYTPRLGAAANEIYAGSLAGATAILPLPVELALLPDHQIGTELPRAPAHDRSDPRIGRKRVAVFVDTMRPMTYLRQNGYAAPSVSLRDAETISRTLNTKELGRTRTLPAQTVFSAVRKAADLILDHGDGLVSSYINVLTEAVRRGIDVNAVGRTRSFTQLLDPDTRKFGVRTWTISPQGSKLWSDEPKTTTSFYSDLRENIGLYESLRILNGACLILIGALSARRHSELYDLTIDCLDETGTRLVFGNRKSGICDIRERESRIIPEVCVEAIRQLTRIHQHLAHLGVSELGGRLFAPPKKFGGNGITQCTKIMTHRSMDLFCDWANTDVDESGRRYYLRHHQLRRFFAMLFFWSNGPGSADVLRYYLGHTDVEHLYNYVTEATPGAVLRHMKATQAAKLLQDDDPSASELAKTVIAHFGTGDFRVIDFDSLSDYLDHLIGIGRMIVEPEFLDERREYRLLIRIKDPSP